MSRIPSQGWVVVIAASIAFLLCLAGVSRAHDHWISEKGHKNKAGEWCCGVGDCFALEYSPGVSSMGYLLEGGEIVPHTEVLPSEDKKFWRCQRPDGSRRCFFAPPMGY